MFRIGILRILAFIVSFQALAAAILDINDRNRNQLISNSHYSLIYFSKDNCKYCRQFEPVYEELSQFYESSSNFQMLKCDSSINKLTKRVFKISSFPTVVLYDSTTQQVKQFDQPRNLINLINFINDHTDVINEEIDSKVNRIDSITPDFAETIDGQNLIVLTLSTSTEWEEYEFPSHEYQQLAYEYDNITFNIIFVDLSPDINEFIRHYRISNFPSVVYFDSQLQQFKLYKTFSTSHMTNDKLTPSMVKEFLDTLHTDNSSENYGTWFKNISELYEYADHQQYEFVDQTNYGFNIRQNGRVDNQGVEVDYQQMIEELEI